MPPTFRALILGGVFAAAAPLSALAAEPALEDGRYVSLSAGVVNVRDAELEYEDNPARDRFASFDNGFVAAGAFGSTYKDKFRLEGELSYRQVDEAFLWPGGGGEGSASATALMANGYWDFKLGPRFAPYVGVGLGGAWVSHKDFVADGAPLADDSGFSFAYQAMAGARLALKAGWAANLEYRYFAAAEPKIDDAEGYTYDTDFESHAVLIGLSRTLR